MTHPTDFRALCAELVEECRSLRSAKPANLGLWDRARAALAAEQGPASSADRKSALLALDHILRHSSTDLGAKLIRRVIEGEAQDEFIRILLAENAQLKRDLTEALQKCYNPVSVLPSGNH